MRKDGGNRLGKTRKAVDRFGNMRETKVPYDAVTAVKLDPKGWRSSVTSADPDGVGAFTSPVTKIGYNSPGDTNKVVNPDGSTRSFNYSTGLHRMLASTDELGPTARGGVHGGDAGPIARQRLAPGGPFAYSRGMNATLKTVTLGCKVNQYETQLVREGLQRAGYVDAADDAPARLCVVNTCTVTSEGDSKSRQAIRRLARENPDARIVVMGCYATRAPEELAALPNVVEVVTDKREIPDLLGRFGVVEIPTGISQFGGRHRAYVKVQDGCMLRCSYCIIPHVRPNLASRPVEHIVEEVARLAGNGYREIVLTGIHLGHYGVDENLHKPREDWTRLSTLVRRLVQVPGDFRIRLSSIEATEVTRELIAVMADHPDRVCPHLHVCLQSGSDQVLRRMRRRWSARMFVDRCQLLREALDQPALTTDIIVGFPGETDDDFEQTVRVSGQAGFSKIHIFPFSARKGTPAAAFPDVVPDGEKSRRVEVLHGVDRALRARYFESLVGKSLRMMVEEVDPLTGEAKGTSCRYATCVATGRAFHSGELAEVRVTEGVRDEFLRATTSPPGLVGTGEIGA